MTMPGKFETQPLVGDWVEFPKLKQAKLLGLLGYTDKLARLWYTGQNGQIRCQSSNTKGRANWVGKNG